MRLLSLTVPGPQGDVTVQAPNQGPTIAGDRLANIPQFAITLIMLIAIVISLIFILFSGIQWITSGGDPKAIEGARKRLTYAIIGLVITLGAFVIVGLVITLLGKDPKLL